MIILETVCEVYPKTPDVDEPFLYPPPTALTFDLVGSLRPITKRGEHDLPKMARPFQCHQRRWSRTDRSANLDGLTTAGQTPRAGGRIFVEPFCGTVGIGECRRQSGAPRRHRSSASSANGPEDAVPRAALPGAPATAGAVGTSRSARRRRPKPATGDRRAIAPLMRLPPPSRCGCSTNSRCRSRRRCRTRWRTTDSSRRPLHRGRRWDSSRDRSTLLRCK